MVYQKPADILFSGISMKGRILRILRGEPDIFFSGEILASQLGVSRVAVWKAVKSLQAASYPVLAGEKGYCWKPETVLPYDDFLHPWEFDEKEPFFHYLDKTDSTMNRAAEYAAKGYPEGTVVSAGEQTAGRGRNGRDWISSKGGLFFTLLERPSICATEHVRVSLAFQIATVRALEQLCRKPIQLHWPNDLYVDGKKIAGILTEFHAEGDRLLWISLGMGVNVNNPLKLQERSTINCSSISPQPLSRREVLLAILSQWELTKKDLESPKLHKEWNSLAWGIGKQVLAKETKSNNRKAVGIFMGIDELGRGVLKGENRERFLCSPGNITIKEAQA
jgi:BirA family biotin operon repressor/biotin-[acetyl-CoA-carboxylase] ligase